MSLSLKRPKKAFKISEMVKPIYCKHLTIVVSIILFVLASCGPQVPKKEYIDEINKCYSVILNQIKEQEIYKEVMVSFNDTFEVMRTDIKVFGLPSTHSSHIDESIFFNSDRKKCLLLVLEKPNDNYLFGTTRVVRGKLLNGKWVFSPSVQYYFDSDYFNAYQTNAFDSISILARYNVLTDGDPPAKGCEIDEEYWFDHLEK